MPDENGDDNVNNNQPQAETGESAATPDPGETTPAGETVPPTWDEYLEGQSEPVQQLYQEHTNGLRSALDSERQQRRDLERQLRDISGQLEEGSQVRQQMEQITGDLEQANRRAAFYEDAAQAGVANFRLAWLALQDNTEDFLDRRGEVDFNQLKARHPELFKQPAPAVPRANAGSGAGSEPTPTPDMNTAIRRMAGKG